MKSFMPPRFPASLVMPLLPVGSAKRAGAQAQLHEEIATVFDALREPLLRYLWTFGLELQDCEEVLQDVFLSLYRHLDRGKTVDNVRAWLFRVAHNLALKQRYMMRRDAESQLDSAKREWAVDPAPDPEESLTNREAHKRVRAVVEALPEQDRRCLFLRAEGLRYREIGEILDMSLGAVSQSLTRSLARMARSAER
jgi:RNA polymerase sigma-70 factor (ECF subfamily)